MGSMGTFGSFGIARLGIYAASAQLNVTGNNIANINTDGYCRQYVDMASMYGKGSDQFGSSLNFGFGVSIDSISQYRDPYMDIRYRDEATVAGELTTYLSGLSDLAFVLDEVAKGDADFGVIEAQISAMLEQLQLLSEKSGSEEYDTLVRSTANTLCQLFNSYADKLNTVAENQLELYEYEIDEVNTLLTNIRDMNEQIRNASIYGDTALTLRDQRNVLIDELSEKIGIDVFYSDEDLGNNLIVQNLTIRIQGTDIELVDGIYCTQLSMDETINMPNIVDENGNVLFDASNSANFMYLDEDGNPTNDINLAGVQVNPAFPDSSDSRWLNSLGEGVDNVFQAGPALNPDYNPGGTSKDGNDWKYYDLSEEGATVYVPNPYFVTVDGTTEFTTFSVPTAFPEYDANGDVINTEYGDWEPWFGGQYAIGIWDEDTGDWQKNADGSYYIATTTNDPYFAAVEDSTGAEYSLIQLNNYVTDGNSYANDNCYKLTLSGLQDKKGKYITDDYGRPLDGDVLLSDTVLSGALQACRELLTEEGEFSSKLDIAMDSDATVKRGIPYYQMSLDALAEQFASMFNTANSLNLQDIFAVNDDDVFYSNQLIFPVELDENGEPIYELLKDPEGNLITSSTDPDTIIYLPDGAGGTTPTTVFEYIYNNGVRDYNWVTDSDGDYVKAVKGDDEVIYYEKINVGTDDENPIYLSPSNFSVYATDQAAFDALVGTTSNTATVAEDLNGGAMVSKVEYLPNDMFVTDSDGNYVTATGAVVEGLSTSDPMTADDFKLLMEEGNYTDSYSQYTKAGALFSNSSSTNNTEGINASNISISRDWSIGDTRIVLAKGADVGSSDNSNVLYMITMMDTDLQYDAKNVATDAWSGKREFFKGSFQEMLTNTVSTLAQDMNTKTTLLQNSEVSKLSLNNSRLAISGVDLNEEASNMMIYQKAYVAASKLMTTLDEVIQTLLNM